MGLRRGARGQRGNGEARQDFFGRRGHDGRGGGSEGGQDPGIREPRRIGNYFIFNLFSNINILFKLVCVNDYLKVELTGKLRLISSLKTCTPYLYFLRSNQCVNHLF